MSIAVRMLACACALLIATGVAMAQTGVGTGVITGVVLDETKGVMPGVTVTVSGPAVMGTPSTTTGANGSYRVTNLPPGEYLVTFELAGFGTVIREGIRVGSGFTATVNAELRPATIAETVTVSGQSPVVDVTSSQVVTRCDTEVLASLPGARDYWAVLAQTPAVSMGRVDVGGSGALTQQPYTAYGLSSAGGVNRAEVEGIMVNEGGGGGGSDMYYTDYGAFAEIGVSAVGNGADMPSPGVLSQLIAKSGGNEYHGNVYFDFQNDKMEATNISDAQIAAGVTGSDVLDPRDTNRLSKFQDFNVDLGGFLVKDKLWWHGAYRRSETGQRYPTLLDGVQDTWVPVATAKATYNLTQAHRLTGFYQFQTKEQPSYLGAIRIGGGRQSPALMTQDTVWVLHVPPPCLEGGAQRRALRLALLRGTDRRLSLGVGPRREVRRPAHRGHRQQLRRWRRLGHGPSPAPAAGQWVAHLREVRLGGRSQLQVRRRGDARPAGPALPGVHAPDAGPVGSEQRRADAGGHLPARVGVEERDLDLFAVP